MATAEQRREARWVSLIFHAVLKLFGLGILARAFDAWENVQPTPKAVQSSGSRWFEEAMDTASMTSRATTAGADKVP